MAAQATRQITCDFLHKVALLTITKLEDIQIAKHKATKHMIGFNNFIAEEAAFVTLLDCVTHKTQLPITRLIQSSQCK